MTRMPKLDRSKLLQFLSKPRHAHEVARYFNTSGKLADSHLRQAVNSGHVLVSEKRVVGLFPNFAGEFQQLVGFLYVSRNSPLLVEGVMQPVVKKNERFRLALTIESTPVKFISKVGGPKNHGPSEQSISAFTDRETGTMRTAAYSIKPKVNLASTFLNLLADKGRLLNRNSTAQLTKRERSTSQGGYRPLSHAERIRMFQAVSDQPLTFREIESRFGVSKQIIESYLRKRLFEEVWGPKDIGLRLKLSVNGKAYLKELQAAAKYDPKIREKAFIRLKRATSL